MIRPGPRLAPLVAAVAAVGVLATLWRPMGLIALGSLVGLGVLATLEGVVLARVRLRVTRPAALTLPIGVPGQVPIQLSHDGDAPLSMSARCRWPDGLGGGASTVSARVPPRAEAHMNFAVVAAQRGETLAEAPVVSCTRWGLIERIASAGDAVRMTVIPDLGAVKRLHQQMTSLFLRGHGTRISPRAGQGREFDRLREYVRGDDYRHLAWKATARRGHPIVREFRLERSQDVIFCLDAGHRMAAPVPGVGSGPTLTRLDHAVNGAVLASWLCDRCEDRVGMVSFAAEVDRGIAQGRGAEHLAAITSFASRIAAGWLHSDYRALAAHLRRRLRQRTLILIATVLPERGDHGELLAAMRMLTPKHLPLVLVVDDRLLEAEADAEPATRAALGRMMAAADIVDGRRQLESELRQLGALVAHAAPADAGVAALNAYLDVKRRQLL